MNYEIEMTFFAVCNNGTEEFMLLYTQRKFTHEKRVMSNRWQSQFELENTGVVQKPMFSNEAEEKYQPIPKTQARLNPLSCKVCLILSLPSNSPDAIKPATKVAQLTRPNS